MSRRTPGPEAASGARHTLLRVALLTSSSVAVGTLAGMFSEEKLNFLYKDDLRLSAGAVATLGIFLGLPDYLRPFLGAWSDLRPLWGYRRRSYYALAALFGAAGLFGLALLPHYRFLTVAMLVLLMGVGGSLGDIMADAVMVEVGNRTNAVGRLQALQQFLPPVLGVLFTAHWGGYVTQHWSYRRCFAWAGVVSLLAFPLAWVIPERRTAPSPAPARRAARARSLAALRGALRAPGLWTLTAFLFYMILTPSPDTGQFYYSVDALHLSKQYLGDLGVYSSAGTILGTVTFAILSPRLSGRTVIWGTWAIGCANYLVLMGLHDHASAKVVAFVSSYITIGYDLGMYLLAARATPAGLEGSVYGVFLAAIALGESLSDRFGSGLYDLFGPANRAHHYTAAHGWFSALACGFGFTLLAALFIPILPRWARGTEVLETDEGAPAHEYLRRIRNSSEAP